MTEGRETLGDISFYAVEEQEYKQYQRWKLFGVVFPSCITRKYNEDREIRVLEGFVRRQDVPTKEDLCRGEFDQIYGAWYQGMDLS